MSNKRFKQYISEEIFILLEQISFHIVVNNKKLHNNLIDIIALFISKLNKCKISLLFLIS